MTERHHVAIALAAVALIACATPAASTAPDMTPPSPAESPPEPVAAEPADTAPKSGPSPPAEPAAEDELDEGYTPGGLPVPGQPRVSPARGWLDKSIVQNAFKGLRDAVKSCYARHLDADSTSSTKVPVVWFRVGADGRVEDAKVSDLDNLPLARCLEDRIRRVTFPPPPEGAIEITYPPH